uniref:Uncharacterized protein n=1 Tax=Molossus molossus TaxID=27622 RepID=A0A7J8EES9_MOLMO|nr:hypothetical protein HJG59_008930 [Molossus molossus]
MTDMPWTFSVDHHFLMDGRARIHNSFASSLVSEHGDMHGEFEMGTGIEKQRREECVQCSFLALFLCCLPMAICSSQEDLECSKASHLIFSFHVLKPVVRFLHICNTLYLTSIFMPITSHEQTETQ